MSFARNNFEAGAIASMFFPGYAVARSRQVFYRQTRHVRGVGFHYQFSVLPLSPLMLPQAGSLAWKMTGTGA